VRDSIYHNLTILEVSDEAEETVEHQANITRQHNLIAELAWQS
jgi:hypothetical protein